MDTTTFIEVGSGWLHGLVPYRDLWGHKPPMIYLIGAAVSTTGDPWTAIRLASEAAIVGSAVACAWRIRHFGGGRA